MLPRCRSFLGVAVENWNPSRRRIGSVEGKSTKPRFSALTVGLGDAKGLILKGVRCKPATKRPSSSLDSAVGRMLGHLESLRALASSGV